MRCCEIARYKLMDDRVTQEVESRYNQAITWLKDVANGTAVLPKESDTSPIGVTSLKHVQIASLTKTRSEVITNDLGLYFRH